MSGVAVMVVQSEQKEAEHTTLGGSLDYLREEEV